MRIGILGTGNVARALATGWRDAGHDIVLASRQPAERTHLGFDVVALDEVTARADILVNATPGGVSVDVLEAAGAAGLADTVLVDVGVGLSDDYTLLSHPNDSLGERIQAAFPRIRVVKTLCTMDSTVMVNPADTLDGPGTVFLSGDSAGAKEITARLLTDLGWPAGSQLDIGPISSARGQEHFALLFMGIAHGLGSHVFNIRVVGRSHS
ncbi:NAD(P)-binding domain-containing protein [Streptomyces sp. CAU 1734]|uniref:NADPH-dependent F420 reductase n=1 Tax=Streptomyces sp. CAU 1734 TaxID=3140360 RepID=UPI0032612302